MSECATCMYRQKLHACGTYTILYNIYKYVCTFLPQVSLHVCTTEVPSVLSTCTH